MRVAGAFEAGGEVDAFGERIAAVAEDRGPGRGEVAYRPVEGHAVEAAGGTDGGAGRRIHAPERAIVDAGAAAEQQTIHRGEVDVTDRLVAAAGAAVEGEHVVRE